MVEIEAAVIVPTNENLATQEGTACNSKINKPEKVFGLQVRCRELDIFKNLGIFEKLFGIFFDFWGNFFGGFFGGIFREEFFERNILGRFFGTIFLRGIFWEEFFVYIVKVG